MKKLLFIALALLFCGCSQSYWLASGQSNMLGTDELNIPDLLSEQGTLTLREAQGSTSILCWRVGGDCFQKYIEPIENGKIEGIVWWQGETDALDGMPPEEYAAQFIALIQEWRDIFGDVPFIFVELQTLEYCKNPTLFHGAEDCSEPPQWTKIREAQMQALSLPDVFKIESQDITNGEIHPTYAYSEIADRINAKIEAVR